jgi:hypothetical protein
LNRGSGKMETRGQMKAYHKETLAGKHGKPAGGPPGTSGGKSKGGGGKPGGQPAPGGFNLETANQGDIHNRAVTQTRLERNAALQPYQAQGAQIQANEAGAQQAYAKLQGSENEQLAKLGTQQEASAKTLQNQMAENALQQGKAIETTGQTQASMTGGYVSPELRSQLLSQSQLAGQTGGAGNQFAQNLAQAGATNLAEMRGTASLKALGGSQNLTNFFQKQQQGVQQNEQGVLAKVAPRALEIEGNLGKEQYTRRATQAALEGKSLAQAQKGKETLARLRTTERGQNITREGHEMTAQTAREGHQQKLWEHTHPTGKATGRKGSGKPEKSPESATKFMHEVSGAEAAGRQVFAQSGKKSLYNRKRQEQVRHYLAGRGASGDVISATLNMLVYGKLGKKDRQTAKAYGVIPEKAPPGWF